MEYMAGGSVADLVCYLSFSLHSAFKYGLFEWVGLPFDENLVYPIDISHFYGL